MTQLGRSRPISAWLCACMLMGMLPAPARAQETAPATATTDVASSLAQARQRLKAGDYDGAIELLSSMVTSEQERTATMGEIYPLYVDAYVQLGNSFKYKDQGRATSDLHFKNARNLVAQCLSNKALRHVRPTPASEFSEETNRFFDEYRNENFGSFRVSKLEPRNAVVLLDADTLRAFPGDSLLGDVDIPKGPHLVVVRARGYRNHTEEIMVPPGTTVERPFRLTRQRGRKWYATVTTGAVGVVGGVIALVARGSKGGTSGPESLPGAPPPPSR